MNITFQTAMHLFRKMIMSCLAVLIAFSTLAQKKDKDGMSEMDRMDFDKFFFAGMKEKMINNFPDAEAEFKKAVVINPRNANIHYQLSTVLIPQKKNAEALMQAEQAFKLDPKNEWYSKLLIEIYKSQKQYGQAIKVCQTAYKNDAQTNYLFEMSGLYLLTGNNAKAISALNEAEKKLGVTEQVCRQKEEIYLSENNIKGATIEIEKLCKAFPDQVQYKGLLADLYMSGNKEKEGIAIYNEIQKNDPRNGFAAFALADYYRSQKDLTEYYNQLLLGMKSDVDPNVKLQVLSKLIPSLDFGTEHISKCKALTEAFAQTNPESAEPYLFKGDLAMQERNLEEARTQYLIAASKQNAGMIAWDQTLFCDQQLQRYDWMKADTKKMMELFPTYSGGYFFYSIACRQLKEYDLAFQSAREALQFAEDEEGLKQMLSNLGDIAHYAKQYTVSDSAYEAVLAIDPNNSLALNNYAYFLSLRNIELDKAESMSKRSIELDPNNASNLDTYGWILFQKKKYTEAKTYIGKSLEIAPNNAEVLEHLGDVLFQMNQKDQALENWQKAKSIGGGTDDLDRKIKSLQK